MQSPDIYDPRFVKNLFNEMADTYGTVNLISSLGFTLWWRAACVRAFDGLAGKDGSLARANGSLAGYDLMCGMGETWRSLRDRLPAGSRLIAIDISESMTDAAKRRGGLLPEARVDVIRGDALGDLVQADSADFIVCCFGLKTLSPAQQEVFADRVSAALKPGAICSFLEISDPRGWPLRALYLFYITYIIPFLGRLFLGNPDNYRMLGVYTLAFGDCRAFAKLLEERGLEVRMERHFFGCATSVAGRRPLSQ